MYWQGPKQFGNTTGAAMSPIAILAVVLSATAVPMPGSAATAPRHYEALITLGHRASNVHADLLQAYSANLKATNALTTSTECLDILLDASGELDSDLGEISDLATLSREREAPADARAVDRVMRIRINGTVQIIGMLRRETSQVIGRCGDSALVQSKGQVLLDLMQEATNQLNELRP